MAAAVAAKHGRVLMRVLFGEMLLEKDGRQSQENLRLILVTEIG